VSRTTWHAQAAASASDVTAGTDVSVSVSGFGGFRGPDASADPRAADRPASIQATDVTIVSP